MRAFFFGGAQHPLFGCYHPPKGTASGAVVLCPSWGSEYQNAHRAMKFLARRLSERGFHVLRFDFSGTGDSWGESTDGHPEQWSSDVGTAIAELQSLSGERRVDLIGLRVGAFVASTAAAGRSDVGRLVLWDPVLHGEAWTLELNRSTRVSVAAEERHVEFGQRLVSTALVQQFREIGTRQYGAPPVAAALCLQTLKDDPAAGSGPPEWIPNLECQWVEDVSPWVEDTSIWSGMVPAKAVNAIVDWMSRR